MYTDKNVFNRPGVAGAVLETPLSLIHYFIDIATDLQNTITPKKLELGT